MFIAVDFFPRRADHDGNLRTIHHRFVWQVSSPGGAGLDDLETNRAGVDAATEIKATLTAVGIPIGPNDTTTAGHAIAAGAGTGTGRLG